MKRLRQALIPLLLPVLLLLFSACTSEADKALKKVELGQKYLTELNYTEAIVAFTDAIGLDPHNLEAYTGRAQAYQGLSQYSEALADYKTVASMTEQIPYTRALAYTGLAECYGAQNDQKKALSYYGIAIALLHSADAGKEEGISKEHIEELKTELLTIHFKLCLELGEYDQALADQEQLLTLGKEVSLPNEIYAESTEIILRPEEQVEIGKVGVTFEGASWFWSVEEENPSHTALFVDLTIENDSASSIWLGNDNKDLAYPTIERMQAAYNLPTEIQAVCDSVPVSVAQFGMGNVNPAETGEGSDYYLDDLDPQKEGYIVLFVEVPDQWNELDFVYSPFYAPNQEIRLVLYRNDMENWQT